LATLVIADFNCKGVHQLVSFQVILAGLKNEVKSEVAQADKASGSATTAILRWLLLAILKFLHNTNGMNKMPEIR
jgi:hypothetical protein